MNELFQHYAKLAELFQPILEDYSLDDIYEFLEKHQTFQTTFTGEQE